MSAKATPPSYVLPVADPVEEPPFYFGTRDRPWIGCGLHLPSDPKALSRLCKTYLDGPLSKSPMARFESIDDTLWCTINLYQQAGSKPQPHEGWVEYLEITFMFAVQRISAQQPPMLCWFLPALFLDGTEKTGSRSVIYAVAGGREIFGLPKTTAAIEFERKGFFDLSRASLEVVDLPLGQKDPAPLSLQKILDVSAQPSDAERQRPVKTGREAFLGRLLGVGAGAIHTSSRAPGFADIPSRNDLVLNLKQVFGGPLVGLKQLHEATDYAKASYQAVIESSYEVEEWYEQRPWLYADHLLTFRDSENVRLIEALGIVTDDAGQVLVPATSSYYLEASAIYGAPASTTIWKSG